jgi:hypothetical protein
MDRETALETRIQELESELLAEKNRNRQLSKDMLNAKMEVQQLIRLIDSFKQDLKIIYLQKINDGEEFDFDELIAT